MRAASLTASLVVAVVAAHAHPHPEQEVQKLDTDFMDGMASNGDKAFDYVVVGGGTAGLALATRLAEASSYTIAASRPAVSTRRPMVASGLYRDAAPSTPEPTLTTSTPSWIGDL